jgi:ketopantoate reductase
MIRSFQRGDAPALYADFARPVPIDETIEMAAKVGEQRTSMLQDAEAGPPTEFDAVVGSVIELGRIVGVITQLCAHQCSLPHIRLPPSA